MLKPRMWGVIAGVCLLPIAMVLSMRWLWHETVPDWLDRAAIVGTGFAVLAFVAEGIADTYRRSRDGEV